MVRRMKNADRRRRACGSAAFLALIVAGSSCSAPSEEAPEADPCVTTRRHFAQQVWPILSAKCTGCHAPGGSATTGENAKRRTAGFVLEWDAYPDFLDVNLAQVARMVHEQIGGVPKLLLKPSGGDSHLGGALIPTDSAEYQVLQRLAANLQQGDLACAGADSDSFAGVELADWNQTFRRAALLLGGRLPTDSERRLGDEASFDRALDGLLTEPAFLQHVKETWNDRLLTDGGDRVQVGPLQFRIGDFPAVQPWIDGPDVACKGKPDVAKCTQDWFTLWRSVQLALTSEPLELIAHVVAKNAPFSEVLTADYTMANPQSAVVYGVQKSFDPPSRDNFKNWKPVRISGVERGAVPHAGLLSSPGFLGRWVSTDTNKGRARARMIYRAFLATDVQQLAQRPVDTAALTGVANPTRNSAACSVCHVVIDPVATSFSNYSDSAAFDYDPSVSAATIRHQEMLPPGLGEQRTAGQETKLLPALAKMLIADERFAQSVVRVAYQGVMGRAPLRYPTPTMNAQDYASRWAAWDAQNRFLHQLAKLFESSGQNYKEVVKAIIKSPFFRASSSRLTNVALAEEVGSGRLLTPELLDRKIEAVAGIPWSIGGWGLDAERTRDLRDRYKILYGGIDSVSVTSRLSSPTPMIANIAERMANEVACRAVAWEFTMPASKRKLLRLVERGITPGEADSDAKIRDNLVELLERAWGVRYSTSDPEIDALFALFTDTREELDLKHDFNHLPFDCLGLWERNESSVYSCGTEGEKDYVARCYSFDKTLPIERRITTDGLFTIGAWMAVVSYVFSDVRFLYE